MVVKLRSAHQYKLNEVLAVVICIYQNIAEDPMDMHIFRLNYWHLNNWYRFFIFISLLQQVVTNSTCFFESQEPENIKVCQWP